MKVGLCQKKMSNLDFLNMLWEKHNLFLIITLIIIVILGFVIDYFITKNHFYKS